MFRRCKDFLKRRLAEKRLALARQRQPAQPQQVEQGEWAEPGFSRLGDSAEVFSIREEVGAGGGAYDSSAWGEDAVAASPPEPSRGEGGADSARGAAGNPEAFSFFSDEPSASPFDALFPPPLESSSSAPAPQLHDRLRRASHVERRERRERLLSAGEERTATLR